MPDYTNNYSDTLKVQYDGPTGQHFMFFHGQDGVSQAGLLSAVSTVCASLAAAQYPGYVWSNAFYKPKGAFIFVLVGELGINSPVIGANIPDNRKDVKFSFCGRSSGGSRAILYLVGCSVDLPDNNRVLGRNNARIQSIVDVLNDNSGIISAIDGKTTRWYSYANTKGNDKIIKRERRNGV